MLKKASRALLRRTYPLWRYFFPGGHRPYQVPGGWIYLNIRESSMMLDRALGCYEPEKHAALRHFLRPGMTFVDVGCNKGDFALAAASLVGESGRVLAFEPAPENCRWIRRSVERNRYITIDLEEFALGDRDCTSQLHLGETSGSHTLLDGQLPRERGVIETPTRRLDDVVDLRLPDAIKIDVEGFELQVLAGAREVLRRNPEIVVFLDVHPHLGVKTEPICQFFAEEGFDLYREESPFDRPLVVDSAMLDGLDHSWSLVAARPRSAASAASQSLHPCA